MSLLAKIKKANARSDQDPQSPSTTATPAPPISRQTKPKREIPAARDWTAKRTLGRPRNQFAKYHLQQHPVADFVDACLLPDAGCSEFIGSTTSRSVETVQGGFVKVAPTYQRLTLTKRYLQYCVEHGYVAVVPRTFGSLVIKRCLENGWPVRPSRAGDTRRGVIQGLSIKGQAPWNGTDDRFLEGHTDRKRWLPKPN
jgi:hypothetical protein